MQRFACITAKLCGKNRERIKVVQEIPGKERSDTEKYSEYTTARMKYQIPSNSDNYTPECSPLAGMESGHLTKMKLKKVYFP